MAKKSIRILAMALILAMTAALLPVSAVAAETTATWNISKSKTATELTGNQTTVTLSLPSAEVTRTSDVELVIDLSDCTDKVLPEVASLMSALYASQQKTNAQIKFGVVAFKGSAAELINLSELNIDTIKTWAGTGGYFSQWKNENDAKIYLKNKISGMNLHGTNLPAGLALAKSILDADTTVSSSHKYVITVTDGLTYLFNNANGETCGIFNNGNDGAYNSYSCLFYQWEEIHQMTNDSVSKKTGILPDNFSWDTYYTNVTKNVTTDGAKYEIAQTSVPIDEWRFITPPTADSLQTYTDFYNTLHVGTNIISYLSADKTKDKDATTHAYGVDRSVYESTETYKAMCGEGYQCYSINPSYSDTKTFGGLFVAELNKLAQKEGEIDFASVKDEIIYLLDSGTVTDVIGNNFDLATNGTACPFTLKVGSESLTGTADASNGNLWNFGTAIDNVYPYTVLYKPQTASTAEQLVWSINVPVENAKKTQLSYTLNLVNRMGIAGSYKVPTNESATLYYTSTSGDQGYEDFEQPMVTYLVTTPVTPVTPTTPTTPTDINTPIPTGLNGVDHIAYIIGRSGYARPNATITRAEVAAIFFRLLTDETRQSHLTSENSFTDVKAGSWYNTAVSTLADMNILKGYADGSFRPDAPITRAEFAAVTARFDSTDISGKTATFTDIAGSWAKDDIERTAILGWVNGYADGSFRPENDITRAEVVTLVNRVLQRIPGKTEDLLDNMIKWPDNADTTAWYYLAFQEASNSHDYEKYTAADKTTQYEKWTKLTENIDWTQYQK